MSRPEPVSAVSNGVRWATRVTSIGLEFALPPMLGGYLDRRWGTGSLLTIVGAAFGFLAGMIHLVAIGKLVGAESGPDPKHSSDKSNESGWSKHG